MANVTTLDCAQNQQLMLELKLLQFLHEAYEIVILSIQMMMSMRGTCVCLWCVEGAICNNLTTHFKCNILHLLKCYNHQYWYGHSYLQ